MNMNLHPLPVYFLDIVRLALVLGRQASMSLPMPKVATGGHKMSSSETRKSASDFKKPR